MKWAYLEHEAYRARHAIAAWFLRDCPLIIDIGCGATPLQPWCSQPVISISPDLPNGAIGFCGPVEDWNVSVAPGYGVCVLGCDFSTQAAIDRVHQLLDSASVTVIESTTDYEPDLSMAMRLIHGRVVRQSIDVDLSRVPIDLPSDSWPARPHRRMWVL